VQYGSSTTLNSGSYAIAIYRRFSSYSSGSISTSTVLFDANGWTDVLATDFSGLVTTPSATGIVVADLTMRQPTPPIIINVTYLLGTPEIDPWVSWDIMAFANWDDNAPTTYHF